MHRREHYIIFCRVYRPTTGTRVYDLRVRTRSNGHVAFYSSAHHGRFDAVWEEKKVTDDRGRNARCDKCARHIPRGGGDGDRERSKRLYCIVRRTGSITSKPWKTRRRNPGNVTRSRVSRHRNSTPHRAPFAVYASTTNKAQAIVYYSLRVRGDSVLFDSRLRTSREKVRRRCSRRYTYSPIPNVVSSVFFYFFSHYSIYRLTRRYRAGDDNKSHAVRTVYVPHNRLSQTVWLKRVQLGTLRKCAYDVVSSVIKWSENNYSVFYRPVSYTTTVF